MNEIVYPPCKYCGKSHQMGIEEMSTGKIDPLDICNECLWEPLEFREINSFDFSNLDHIWKGKNVFEETVKHVFPKDGEIIEEYGL